MKNRLLYFLPLTVLTLTPTLPAPAQSAPATREIGRPVTQTATAQSGPSGIIGTVAGDGYLGTSGNGGPATAARMIFPQSVAVDSAGNLYIADVYAQVVRVVNASTGVISAYAGTGTSGYSGDKGPATSAQLNEPASVALDSAGNVYIADSRNNVIREVNAKTGIITTVAGNGYGAGPGLFENSCGMMAEGVAATQTSLCYPQAVALDAAGNIYIADSQDEAIREVNAKTGLITRLAGTGVAGYTGDGGPAVTAQLSDPYSLALDSKGNIYIADEGNCAIREITVATGEINSLVGVPYEFYGSYYGSCSYYGDGGPASEALLYEPEGVAVDRAGNVFIADTYNERIRVIDASTGNIDTVAGGQVGYWGDGGPGAYAGVEYPAGMTADSKGNLYFADLYNSAVRKLTYAAVQDGEMPAISPSGNTTLASGISVDQFTTPVTVTITSPVTGAVIRYSTDGSVPTLSSAKYTAPFKLGKSAMITAFATVSGAPNTPAAIAAYLYTPAPVLSRNTAVFTAPFSLSVSDTNAAAKIYYTDDGASTPEGGGPAVKLYTGPISITGTTPIDTQAWVSITDAAGNVAGAWSQENYIGFLYAPAPTFSPGTKTLTAASPVTISDANATASIAYTTDGSDPTKSTTAETYSAPVTISATTVLKAAAKVHDVDGDMGWSAIGTATYTLATAPAVVTQAATAASITASGATLNGTVTANNATTQYWFAYGTSKSALTSTTAKVGGVTGSKATAVTAALTKLTTKTTYYFQVVASNAEGTTPGTILSFTTD